MKRLEIPRVYARGKRLLEIGLAILLHPRDFLQFFSRQLRDYERGRARGGRGGEVITDSIFEERLRSFMTSPPATLLPAHTLDGLSGPARSADGIQIGEADGSELPPAEREAIIRIVSALNPRMIFEIGTYRGRTTRLLAACSPQAVVHTLDLPPERMLEGGCFRRADVRLIGARFGEEAWIRSRILQHFGDSRDFDFKPFYGQVDLVFVDASHAYEAVLNDSREALRMVNECGVVVWDDYHPVHGPGVMKALSEIGHDRRIVWIAGTRLAMYGIETMASRRRDLIHE